MGRGVENFGEEGFAGLALLKGVLPWGPSLPKGSKMEGGRRQLAGEDQVFLLHKCVWVWPSPRKEQEPPTLHCLAPSRRQPVPRTTSKAQLGCLSSAVFCQALDITV